MSALHVLPGFMGMPTDFDHLGLTCKVHDATQISPPSKEGLCGWAEKFNGVMSKSKSPKVLLGYSLGGRLALHALVRQPKLWRGAVIISAHPGLSNLKEKQARIETDQKWVDRFQSESWNSLMEEFNKNDIFNNVAPPFVRKECDYSRTMLSDIFQYWGLSTQQDLKDQIEQLDIPILWVAGENDSRYAAQANAVLLSHTHSRKWIAPHAGHRVPWERQEEFKLELKTFLENC